METLKLLGSLLLGVFLLVLFFAGWAGVYFASDKLEPGGYDQPAWKWVIFWGVYLGSMLAYPVVVTVLGGAVLHYFGLI